MHFTLKLIIHLKVQSRGALEGTFDGAHIDIHKDAQEGAACEVTLKDALEGAPVMR